MLPITFLMPNPFSHTKIEVTIMAKHKKKKEEIKAPVQEQVVALTRKLCDKK